MSAIFYNIRLIGKSILRSLEFNKVFKVGCGGSKVKDVRGETSTGRAEDADYCSRDVGRLPGYLGYPHV